MRPSVFDVVIRRTGAATGAVAVALTLMALGGGWVSPREPGGALGVLDARASAAHLGATGLVLVGFDWDAPVEKPGRDPALKRRKLAWAREIVGSLGLPVRML